MCIRDRYHLDATFDNSLGRYGQKRFDYFNLDDKMIFRDHQPLVYKAVSYTHLHRGIGCVFHQCQKHNGKRISRIYIHGRTVAASGLYSTGQSGNQLPAWIHAGDGESGSQGKYLCAA